MKGILFDTIDLCLAKRRSSFKILPRYDSLSFPPMSHSSTSLCSFTYQRSQQKNYFFSRLFSYSFVSGSESNFCYFPVVLLRGEACIGDAQDCNTHPEDLARIQGVIKEGGEG